MAAAGQAKVIIVKKKAKGHGAHHGGAWKVAYADFVTAMMALFIVLWLLSQTNEQQREQLAEYFRTGVLNGAPSVLNGGAGLRDRGYFDVKDDNEMSAERKDLDKLAAALEHEVDRIMTETPELAELAKQVQVRVTSDGLLIQILDGGDDLLFDLSSAELKPRLVELLARLAPALARLPNRIQLHGHTDARPFPVGSNRSNWQLSFERADRARGVLEKNGVPTSQVVGVFAHGDTSLYDPKDPFAAQNRRLAILAVRRGKEKPSAQGVPPS